jgi:hypothetical protein
MRIIYDGNHRKRMEGIRVHLHCLCEGLGTTARWALSAEASTMLHLRYEYVVVDSIEVSCFHFQCARELDSSVFECTAPGVVLSPGFNCSTKPMKS